MDPWLTEMLGFDVFRLEIDDLLADKFNDSRSEERQMVDSILKRNVMVYSKIGPISIKSSSFLFNRGFRLVDTNLLMKKELRGQYGEESCVYPDVQIRFARAEDEKGVVALARRSFYLSRFHLDQDIRLEDANDLKAEWARNYFRGTRGQEMVVAVQHGLIIAFLQLLYLTDQLAIDLIAVDSDYRSRGIGKKIIRYAISHCRNFTKMRVGTQIANTPSIKLYESLGFKVDSFQHVFHYHNHKSL